jgi:SAM-dependent methyltransferase
VQPGSRLFVLKSAALRSLFKKKLISRIKMKDIEKNKKDLSQPQIWHHGLVARYWAEFQTDGGKECMFFKKIIETSGQPALDLGCGSGRLLLQYLQAGMDVDGVDISEDMLAVCQERAKKEGLSPQLYEQAMHQLDLPRHYHTIIACGVVGLGGERRLTMQAMQRCYEHLHPGGKFAFDYMVRWNDPPAWLSRLPEHRRALPQEWPLSSERVVMSDGSEMEITARTVSVDPLEEVAARQVRARLWQNGELVKEEIHTQRLDDYSKNELILMLERAGFDNIQIYGDYSDETATMDHKDLIFVATK